MSKRVAVVTGGIGGLGTEICKTLARAGRTVVAADLGAREERIAQFRQDVEDLGEQKAGLIAARLSAVGQRKLFQQAIIQANDQLYYTLSQPADVDAVSLAVEGRPLTVLGGEGVIVDPVWVRADHPGVPTW